MYKGLIKLKSTDQVIWVEFENVDDLNKDYAFWVFTDMEKGKGQVEKWIRVDDVCYFEFWQMR